MEGLKDREQQLEEEEKDYSFVEKPAILDKFKAASEITNGMSISTLTSF